MNEDRNPIKEELHSSSDLSEASLNILTPDQIVLIDTALSDVGPYGEVRLVKAKGKLRFIQKLESLSAL